MKDKDIKVINGFKHIRYKNRMFSENEMLQNSAIY